MNNLRNYDEEISKLEKELKDLKQEKLEYDLLSNDKKLAIAIHSVQCTWNHTDGCGWYYESWDNPSYSKKRYLEKANNMLEEMDFEQAMKVIKFM